MGILATFGGKINRLLEVGVFIPPNFKHHIRVPEFKHWFSWAAWTLGAVGRQLLQGQGRECFCTDLTHEGTHLKYIYMYILAQKFMKDTEPVET